jgi:hypothetical protein
MLAPQARQLMAAAVAAGSIAASSAWAKAGIS